MDALVGNTQSTGVQVWLNNGAGNFTGGQSLSARSFALALRDLDGDGDLDVFVGNTTSSGGPAPDKVWLNEGGMQGGPPGHFTDSGQNLGNSSTRALALGDVDGDGDLDAFVGNQLPGASPNKVWLNDSTGHFTGSGQNLGNSFSLAIDLGDVDGDGDLDAFEANRGDPPSPDAPNRVWLNDGGVQGGPPGHFTDSDQSLGNSASAAVALGDVDGDGDLDAFIGNHYGEANKVWLNVGGGPPPGGIYLPIILKAAAPPTPDLVVDRITATGNNVEVVIKNIGDASVTEAFWVDVYINPNPAPTQVNQIWPDLASQGLVWGVDTTINPGETLTLSINDPYYFAAWSTFSGSLAQGTPVYVQVDSVDFGTTYGSILETHELAGGSYNNIDSTVSTLSTVVAEPLAPSGQPPAGEGLPPRE